MKNIEYYKSFDNLDDLIDFLAAAGDGMEVKGLDVDTEYEPAARALQEYQEIRDHSSDKTIALWEGARLSIRWGMDLAGMHLVTGDNADAGDLDRIRDSLRTPYAFREDMQRLRAETAPDEDAVLTSIVGGRNYAFRLATGSDDVEVTRV